MVLKVFPKGDFLGLLICCSQKNSDQETLKIPFVAISFKSNLRMTGLNSPYKGTVSLDNQESCGEVVVEYLIFTCVAK